MSEIIQEHRDRLTRAITTPHVLDAEFIAVLGPCSNQFNETIIAEGKRVNDLNVQGSVFAMHRIPFWKPRSPRPADEPQPWTGIISDDLELAIEVTRIEAEQIGVPVAAEIGHPDQLEHFAGALSMAWIGSRTVGDVDLISHVSRATNQTGTPLGIKNGMNGEIASALQGMGVSASFGNDISIPIFRGGEDMQTPERWETGFRRAHALTAGNFIVDLAHGGEQAHDPKEQFGKSVGGQIRCLEHLIELASEGLVPKGVMMEASDVAINDETRRTDPNMPMDVAIEGVEVIHDIRMRLKHG